MPRPTSLTTDQQITPSWQYWLRPLQAAQQKAAEGGFCAIDGQDFSRDCEALCANQMDQSDMRKAFLELLKTYLERGYNALNARLIEERDGAHYVGAHALMMDMIISNILCVASQHVFNNQPHFAIMAVGGYGRGELAPYSDIDLLFVMPEEQKKTDIELIEFMLYLLWDMGMTVGHASRTIAENLTTAHQDITISTTLLEMRYIAGDSRLANQMAERFTDWLKSESVSAFVGGKLEERALRHNRSGGTRYAVEPNVKDGKGGLRDLHTLFWIAKFAYRLNDIIDVLETGILRVSEASAFAASQRFLWTVRCFLHLHHGRNDDRLTFDAQTNIAPQLRFIGKIGLRDVERFMKRYYLAARQVGNLTRIFCATLETEFARAPHLGIKKLSFLGANIKRDIFPFILENDRLHLPDHLRFDSDRHQIVRLFYFAQIHQLDIHPDSFRRLTRAVRSAKSADLQTKDTHHVFLTILTDKRNLERVLRLMNESEWLGKYLPDFGRIVGMMQFDMYHSYTVDEHTIKAVGIMNEVEQGKLAHIAPIASQLIHEIVSRRALYVAIFLHDIAKGRGGDHSILGAEISQYICVMLGLDAEECETVIWLIRHHLLMSRIAFHYDLNDPQTISDFAAKVQSPERLKLLLVLTVADIQAVGPDIWNGWKASLMRDLYRRSEAILGGAAPSEVSVGAADDAKQNAKQNVRQRLDGWDDQRFDHYAALFYPSYWTNFSTESHVYHAHLSEMFNPLCEPLLIDFKTDEDKKSTVLVVMAADHPGLFSQIVGAVALAGCSIMAARINTRHDGTILDQFRIQDQHKQAVAEPKRHAKIATIIEKSVAGDISLFDKLEEKSAQISKRIKALTVPPRVIVTNGRSTTHTVIEVNGPDRPWLLYQITYHLVQLGLQINAATVSTYGEKVVDVFYVKDVYGLQIEKPATQEKIRQTLLGLFDRKQRHQAPLIGKVKVR